MKIKPELIFFNYLHKTQGHKYNVRDVVNPFDGTFSNFFDQKSAEETKLIHVEPVDETNLRPNSDPYQNSSKS